MAGGQPLVKKFALIVMLIAVLAAPASAVAADGYTNVAGVNQGGGPTSSTEAPAPVATASSPSSSGILPFTGLELALMFGAGVVLLGTGIALRRARTH
jgi:hypothetical protein